MLQFSPSELLGGSVLRWRPRFAVYPDSSYSAVALVAARRSEFIRIDLLVKGVLIVSGLSCRWWKFATRELYGMKFMQSNIKLGRDLSNL
jgi:hypothetical protein